MMDRMEAAMSHVAGLEPDQLRSLIAHAAGLHAEKAGIWPTTDAMRRIISALYAQGAHERMRDIAWRVAQNHGITVAELCSSTRSYWASHPRQEAMYLMRLVMTSEGKHRYSLPAIARFFGLKDHTTVLLGVRSHQRRQAAEQARELEAA